jgi:ribonuclease HI
VSHDTSKPDALVAIYADESCLGNGREGENPGGVGVLLEFQRRGSLPLVRRDLWISERPTTNNRMALKSVIESMTALSGKGRTFRVVFTTDSRYIVDGMTEWVHKWSKQGWTRKTGPIENLELWQRACEAAKPHAIQWRWVRGHAGHAQNEYANDLAVRAAGALSSSKGLVESGFDAWLAEKSAKGKGHVPEPFPDAEQFRASRPLPTCRPASP